MSTVKFSSNEFEQRKLKNSSGCLKKKNGIKESYYYFFITNFSKIIQFAIFIPNLDK